MSRLFCGVTCLLLIGLSAAACGDEVDPAEDRYPALPSAAPLEVETSMLGVGLRHGEALAMSNDAASSLATTMEALPHAFLHLKAYDEFAPTFGEYYVHMPPSTVSARGPTSFKGEQRSAGRLAARAGDLVEEIADAEGVVGNDGFEDLSFVVDFWRTRGDWYVRWDGLLDDAANRVGKGPYGFFRRQMVDDLLDDLEEMASTYEPKYLIIGSNMERLFATEDGAGLSSADFSNFANFYRQAIARVRAASPETRVGVGFHWDNFVTRIASMYSPHQAADIAGIDRAFEAIILPLAEISDVLALASYTSHDATHGEAYQFLRRLPDLYGLDRPVVWYSVGAPVTSKVSYPQQRVYLENFRKWNAGVPVEAIGWRMLLNFEGADTGNQVVSRTCASLTDPERDFQMAVHHCFDGLFTSVFQPKPVFEYFTGLNP